MKLIIPLLLIIVSASSYSQQILKLKEAERGNINIAELDSIYMSGIHVDTSLAVFKSNTEEYYNAWVSFMQSLGKFLSENDFYWEETTKGFNRIYFNKDGGIDYWLFHINEGQIAKEKEEQFELLLNKFAAQHKFPLLADVSFAQCGGAQYQASKKKE